MQVNWELLQAVILFLLLAAVTVWDIRFRMIPDRLQAAIFLTGFLKFQPQNLWGLCCMVPYLLIALLSDTGGIGGGDIKLAGSIGAVLGLEAGLAASVLGLGTAIAYAGLFQGRRSQLGNTGNTEKEKRHAEREHSAIPLGPFLSLGAATAYLVSHIEAFG